MATAILLGSGLLAPLVYLAGILYAAAAYPGYRHSRQFTSELGTEHSPRAAHFNKAQCASGALLVLFALGVAQALGPGLLAYLIALGLAVFGAATVVMGRYPCDPGCPATPRTFPGVVHVLAGLLGSLALALTMLLVAVALWPEGRGFALYSLITALSALLILLGIWFRYSAEVQGVVQRLYSAVTLTWVVGLSVALLGL
ncbi:MAG: DUF998 domain-containing protein [Thiohalorhabdus sp.]